MSTSLELSEYNKISTDTRTITDGSIFLPLVGANFDGHDYIQEALAKGAIKAYSHKGIPGPSERVIKVKNTLETYHQLANEYRNKVNPITIAITGSSGKTTTKEMLRHVLAEKYKVHYSKANFNNEVGVPKTILEMPQDTEVLVVEMGMRGLGEIELLSRTAEPDIAIITNIGTAHIERLGSQENIQKAKLEITACLKDTLIVDINLYNKLVSDKTDLTKLAKQVKHFNYEHNYQIQGLAGDAIHADANAVALVAQELGLSSEQIQSGLNKYQPGQGRGSFHKDSKGNLFIDDSYNANPESVRASVDALISQFPNEAKIALIGDLLESEETLINETFTYIKELEVSNNFKLLDARNKDIDSINKELENLLSSTDSNSIILVKASRGAALERVIESQLDTYQSAGTS